jgi:predicted FMN-binding regulatory protein PaiB
VIRWEALAVMVTSDEAGAPFATQLPMLLDETRGPLGTLLGHVTSTA